jgi:tetratricopeptide (TPR) repeat protein
MSPHAFHPLRSCGGLSAFAALVIFLFSASVGVAEDADEVRKLLLAGKYADAADVAEAAEKTQAEQEDWPLLRIEALMAVGKYPQAKEVLLAALERFPYALRLRLAGYDVCRANGDTERAKLLKEEMDRFGGQRDWAYRGPADRVAIGKASVLLGVDPKRVTELFFDPVKKANPDFPDTYLANGDLALAKHDFALAAKSFAAAAKKFSENAEAHFGLARAFAPSDGDATEERIAKTLELNPNHAGAKLLLADHAIDSENYPEAEKQLAEVLRVNPRNAEAHAFRAVLADLRSDAKAAAAARAEALKLWPTNPAVPHLIGHKLSKHYRFAEGAELQRQVRSRIRAREDPARAGSPATRSRRGGVEAGGGSAEGGSLRCGGLQPHHAARHHRTFPDTEQPAFPSPHGPARGGGVRRGCARAVGARARVADEKIRPADLREDGRGDFP